MSRNRIVNLALATIMTLNITGCVLQKQSFKGEIINNISLKDNSIKNYEDRINNFINTIEEVIPEIDTSCFFNNLNSLIIVDNTKSSKEKLGSYNIDKNEIILANENDGSLEHELTHVLFADRKNNKNGLMKEYKNYGVSINEGFTELISSEIMQRKNTYRFQTGLAKVLTTIIGRDKMIEILNKKDISLIHNELAKIKLGISDANDFIEYCDYYYFLASKMHRVFFETENIEKFKKTEDFRKLKDIKRVIIGRIKIYIKAYFNKYLNDNNYEQNLIDMINMLDVVDFDLFDKDIDINRQNDFFLKEEVNYLTKKHKIDDNTYNNYVKKARNKVYFKQPIEEIKEKNIK